jgi:fucose 4-O-acetylase-like acetyltransferase
MSKISYRRQGFVWNVDFPKVWETPWSLSSSKDLYVETLRGLAIILVVLGHVIGYTKTGGMKVADDSIFRYLYFSLEYIRMPLFAVISGWVYANKPIYQSDKSDFILGKLRRLILPMFVVSTLLFLFRMVIPGTNSKPQIGSLASNLIYPYDVFWFLYSMFLIFIIISVLDTQPFFERLQGWAIALAISFVLLFFSKNYMEAIPNFFSFKGALYLLPFFLVGIGVYRFHEVLLNNKIVLALVAIFIVGVTLQQMSWFGYLPIQTKHGLLGIAVGLSGVLLLFKLRWRSKLLAWIGNYAFGIFLFHVFFTGGTRIVLLKLGIEEQWTILVVSLFSAIILSIITERLVSKSKILSYYLLGRQKRSL